MYGPHDPWLVMAVAFQHPVHVAAHLLVVEVGERSELRAVVEVLEREVAQNAVHQRPVRRDPEPSSHLAVHHVGHVLEAVGLRDPFRLPFLVHFVTPPFPFLIVEWSNPFLRRRLSIATFISRLG